MLRLTVTDAISHPAKRVNEDLFDHNEQAAWIFDGATGLAKDTIPGAASDPHWLVHTINEELKRVWDNELPTRELLRQAAQNTIARYETLVSNPPPVPERPTACFTMIRAWDHKIEIASIGDSGVIYNNNRESQVFGCVVYAAAEKVRAERKRLLASGISPHDLMAIMLPLHEEFRSLANIDGGYDIVDTTIRWVDRIKIQTIEAQKGDCFILLTDGLYRLIDVFEKYDAASLLNAAKSQGLAALYNELRMLETSDPDCKKFHRAKISDDVAAALIAIY